MAVPVTGYTELDLVGFTDKGTYNAATTYVANDLVSYNGIKWKCLQDGTVGVTPAEGVSWSVFIIDNEINDNAISATSTWSSQKINTTKADQTAIAPVENGTTASRAYAIGEHFMKDGAFCTAIAAIAQGATFTLDTNYTAGTVGARVAEIEGDVNALEENIAKAIQGVHCRVSYTSATTSGSPYDIGTLSSVTDGKLTQRSQVLGCVVDKIEGNNTVDYKGIVTVLNNGNVRYYANTNNSRVTIEFTILTNAL